MARKDSKGRNLRTGESERKQDGMYMYRYTDERSGKRQTVYAKTLQQLREKEKQIAKDMDDDILQDPALKKMTVNTLTERYLEIRTLSPSTRANYVNMWKLHAKDEIGNIKVIQLRPSHVKMFYAKMSKASYSHSTIKLIHMILLPALEMAVDDDLIRKNPAKNALASSYGKPAKKKTVLTFEQQEKLFNFLRESNVYNVYVPMLTILLEVGLRCGELIGLTWDDVDMERKEFSINHQLVYKDFGDGYRLHASTPKTDAGVRKIPMSGVVHRAFMAQKKLNSMLGRRSVEEVDGYSGFVFLAKTGSPLMPGAVNNAIYNVIDAYNKMEEAKAKDERRKAEPLPKISAHNLRHIACTNMVRRGMNVKVLQYILGHASCKISLDVYSHIGDVSEVREEIERHEKTAGF